MQTVGFIVLGIMGEAMCARIVSAGYLVHAYDCDPSGVETIAARKAIPAASAAYTIVEKDIC